MKKLLITDVDNTLFDWQKFWYESFSAMSEKALQISGLNPDIYYSECQALHQKHGTSEYSFVLTQLPSFQRMYGERVADYMQPAIEEFRQARNKYLKLYEGVEETLQTLKSRGVEIVAFTESKEFYANYRFRKLGLDGLVDYLFSPRDHELPDERKTIRKYDPDSYRLKHTKHKYTPDGELKPNPHILQKIIEDLGFSLEDAVYLGDSLYKDILMAQKAGVDDAFAAYGAAQNREVEYDLLKRVTHWTPEMVQHEREVMRSNRVVPTYTLQYGFSEIIKIMEG